MKAVSSDLRWTWLVSAGLLIASGVMAWSATSMWWRPCASALLVGTMQEPTGSAGFDDACLVRMDSGTPFPLPTAVETVPTSLYGLVAGAILLAAFAWLVAVLTTSMPRSARVAGLALVASLAALGVAGLHPVPREADPSVVGSAAFWLIDVLTVVWLACFSRGPVHRSPRTTVRLMLLLGGVTAFSALRGIFDYAVMATWSQANWDVPPGTGFVPALVLILCGVGIAVLTLRGARSERSAPAAPQQVQQVGPIA